MCAKKEADVIITINSQGPSATYWGRWVVVYLCRLLVACRPVWGREARSRNTVVDSRRVCRIVEPFPK